MKQQRLVEFKNRVKKLGKCNISGVKEEVGINYLYIFLYYFRTCLGIKLYNINPNSGFLLLLVIASS